MLRSDSDEASLPRRARSSPAPNAGTVSVAEERSLRMTRPRRESIMNPLKSPRLNSRKGLSRHIANMRSLGIRQRQINGMREVCSCSHRVNASPGRCSSKIPPSLCSTDVALSGVSLRGERSRNAVCLQIRPSTALRSVQDEEFSTSTITSKIRSRRKVRSASRV
jgi:hypothetical protein